MSPRRNSWRSPGRSVAPRSFGGGERDGERASRPCAGTTIASQVIASIYRSTDKTRARRNGCRALPPREGGGAIKSQSQIFFILFLQMKGLVFWSEAKPLTHFSPNASARVAASFVGHNVATHLPPCVRHSVADNVARSTSTQTPATHPPKKEIR